MKLSLLFVINKQEAWKNPKVLQDLNKKQALLLFYEAHLCSFKYDAHARRAKVFDGGSVSATALTKSRSISSTRAQILPVFLTRPSFLENIDMLSFYPGLEFRWK